MMVEVEEYYIWFVVEEFLNILEVGSDVVFFVEGWVMVIGIDLIMVCLFLVGEIVDVD